MKIALLLIAFIGAALTFPLMGPEEKGASEQKLSIGSYMQDVRIESKKAGRKQWSLNTKRVDLLEDVSVAEMHSVSIDLPSEGLKVDADSGTYDISTGDVSLYGNIEARTDDYVIRTSRVSYDSKLGELQSSDYVEVEGENFRFKGRGLRAAGQEIWVEEEIEATLF